LNIDPIHGNVTHTMIEPHFVCIGGCGKVSPTQDKCNSVGCWRARNPLAECDCTDGKHTEFFKMYNPSRIIDTPPSETDTISD